MRYKIGSMEFPNKVTRDCKRLEMIKADLAYLRKKGGLTSGNRALVTSMIKDVGKVIKSIENSTEY